ncbi:MAG: deoxyribose-phosphate aldolase [Lentisphaerae bacterium GWF2_49_21]|nr:MAG: deoxyribose-phosphate aldolase [Lentisphaerae bacterium GWF2_49_21]
MKINRYLDAAILKPETTRKETIAAINECLKYKTMTACVRPCDIELAKSMCKGTDTFVCCVLNFPHGNDSSDAKQAEAELYVKKGVVEIDMVANFALAKSAEWKLYEEDIRVVSSVTKKAGIVLKVIFETCYLSIDEIRLCTKAAIAAEADFVKTSTGFGTGGATDEAVRAMLETADGKIKVKPSGGIRDYARAKSFIDMGCHRLGVNFSSVAAICDGGKADGTDSY